MNESAQAISLSPITGKTYEVPKDLDDRSGIDHFLEKHPGKKVIVVQGLGFVGAVMGLVCANALTSEYAVIGIDLPRPATFWRICSINEGIFPVVASDAKLAQFHQSSLERANLYATFDPYAYSKADVIIVDINLDVYKQSDEEANLIHYDVDLRHFIEAIETIASHCREDVLVLVETTVPPGTCERIVKPTIARCLAARGLAKDRFHLGHSYERVMPGPNYIDSIQNFYRVYSGLDDHSAAATEAFLKTIISTEKYPLTRLASTNATEMAKVLENSYRAMNIAFIVEWSRFAEETGVNLYEVVNAIRMRPTHSNMMLPGLGVGGYCLTKDPLLASWSRRNLFDKDFGLSQSEQGVRINDKMPFYAYHFLRECLAQDSLSGLRVLLLGVSYRSDVADTRYSPVASFYDYLVVAGCKVTLHDYYVTFWEEKHVQVATELEPLFDQRYEVIAITTAHSLYKQRLEDVLTRQEPLMIFDTIGLLSEAEISRLARKHQVRVVGRGDLMN